MSQNLRLSNVDLWRTELGLFPIPLFSDQEKEQRFVLLNGQRGNFCLDLGRAQVGDETRNFAWSANVGHYVALVDEHIEVQRWDQKRALIERYSQKSVRDNLEMFHAYLEKDSPRQEMSIVSHTIQAFRSLRTVLGSKFDGSASLKAFLYLLACATDSAEQREPTLEDWRLSEQAVEIASTIRKADWIALQRELAQGRPVESLVPNLTLLLRHAAGQLFQEAHYEAMFIAPNQLMLGGFLPSPIRVSKEHKGIGLHFTPPALARTLVEESFITLGQRQQSIVIFDPACGSGEFLREALRQLDLSGYSGQIKLVGWDISEAACDMANFVLAWETRDVQVKVVTEIHCINSLSSDQEWPKDVDMVLMNPPFVSWQNLDAQQKKTVTGILGKLSRQRPDLSHAFLWKAASCLRDGGVLGTILPASFLDSTSAERLRQHLGEQMSPRLLARLGSHLLFSDAMIDAAFYVATKGTDSVDPAVAFWADHRSSSNSAGLRTLRKIRYSQSKSAFPVIKEGFSIYLNSALGRTGSGWAPRPYSSWKLLQSLSHLPRVEELFDVKQGIRTGHNKAFLLERGEWSNLPESEKLYFRPAVVNKSINNGFLQDIMYVFYPHGEHKIENEDELQKVLGGYYLEYLLPAKSELQKRARVNLARWWELTLRRTWQVERSPKLVSTYFGDAGSFAWDETGNFVVLQGCCWLPKPPRASKFSAKVGFAYLAVLNSSLFSELLSATSNHVGGGQWNLSTKFVNNIAIPDLFSAQSNPAIISELAEIGRQIHAGSDIDGEQSDTLLRLLYGIDQRM